MLLQSLGHHDPGIKSNDNSLLFGHDEATLSLSYGMRGSNTISSLSQHHGEAILASSYDISGNSLLQHHGQSIQHPCGNHSSTVLQHHDGTTLSSSYGIYSTNHLLQHHGNGIKHPCGVHSIIYLLSQEQPMLLQPLGHHDPGVTSNRTSLLFGHDEATLSPSYGMHGSTTTCLPQHHDEATLSSSCDVSGTSLLQHHGKGIQHPYGNHSSTVLQHHNGTTLSSSHGFYSTIHFYNTTNYPSISPIDSFCFDYSLSEPALYFATLLRFFLLQCLHLSLLALLVGISPH